MDICLIYFSSSVVPFQEADLLGLVDHSRSRNREVGITGVLLYVRGSVIQVLAEKNKPSNPCISGLSKSPGIGMFR
jgi:hypothetical protein